MRLQCLGINHRTAEVYVREKLAFQEGEIGEFLEKAKSSLGVDIYEALILSTCNRVEIYAVADRPVFDALIELLTRERGIPLDGLSEYFYRLVDEQVVSHLLRVSAGMDSMVLGEPQILGQVTEAYEMGLRYGGSGKVLSKLFQAAIYTGKRVRTETAIGRNSVSVSSLAARRASEIVPDLKTAQITLLGAGEMAELAVEAFRKRGVEKFFVISRTINSACGLAERWDGQAGTLENLAGALESTDILITSTSAPHTLIHEDMILQVMAKRPERPIVVIDIAVPRDVVPEVGEIPGVRLFDIDNLNQGVEESLAGRVGEVPLVEQIIEEEYGEFNSYYATLKVVPVIAEMRKQADSIREQELEKTLKHLNSLGENEQAKIAAMTRSIVQKILHVPTTRLKEAAVGPEGEKYAKAAKALFGLETSEPEEYGITYQ